MTKTIKIETACLVNGQHADVDDRLTVPTDVDAETADLLIRHHRASLDDGDEKPSTPKSTPKSKAAAKDAADAVAADAAGETAA